MAVVSFDFDDTLAESINTCYGGKALYGIHQNIELLKEYHALGSTCIILTARTETELSKKEIEDFLDSFDVLHCIDRIIFTNHELKGPFALAEKVNLHYDDSLKHLISVKSYNIAVVCTNKSLQEFY